MRSRLLCRRSVAGRKVYAGNRTCNHVFLDLDQVGVRVGHSQDRKNFIAAHEHHQRTGPIVVVRHAAIAKLYPRQSANRGRSPRDLPVIVIDFAHAMLDRRGRRLQRFLVFSLPTTSNVDSLDVPNATMALGSALRASSIRFQLGSFVNAEIVGVIDIQVAANLIRTDFGLFRWRNRSSRTGHGVRGGICRGYGPQRGRGNLFRGHRWHFGLHPRD